MTQGVVYQAANDEIITANPAAERILGLSVDQTEWENVDGSAVESYSGKWFPFVRPRASEHDCLKHWQTGEEFHHGHYEFG